MAIITEVEKLRPDLLTKSAAELKRMAAEIQMAIEHQEHETRRKEVAGVVDEANAAIEAIVGGLRILEKNNLLSDEAKLFYSSATGAFMPHLRFKPVTADRVIVRNAEKPVKKTRRKKSAK